MRYLGGKAKIAKQLGLFLSDYGQNYKLDTFVDAFCGSMNITCEITGFDRYVANDKHLDLMLMWSGLLDGSFVAPSVLSEEEYKELRHALPSALRGFAGFGCSFADIWFIGYARSANRNYCLNAKNSLKKKLARLCDRDLTLHNLSFEELELPDNSLIYCDIPYKNTTGYKLGFDHDRFYEWILSSRDRHILVSEYGHNVPEFAEVIWSKESRKSLRDKNGEQVKTLEVVWRLKR